MKKTLAFALAIFFSGSIHAQMNSGLHHKMKSHYWFFGKYYKRITFKYTTNDGETFKILDSLPQDKLKANLTQDVQIKKKPIVKIDFWGVNDTTSSFYLAKVDSTHYYYFELPEKKRAGDVTKFISIPYAAWEFGVTTIPFKYRFGNRSSDSLTAIPNETTIDINAGIYVGRKWGTTRYFADKSRTSNSLSYTFAVFASPTVISLSPKNTLKKVTRESSELGIGTGLAFMVAYRDLNIGILSGYDLPVSGESSKWIYSSRPWIGFGVGYKLALLGAGK